MGAPKSDPRTEQVIAMLTPEDRDAVDALAARERKSRSEYVRDLLIARIESEGVRVLRGQLPGQMSLLEEIR